MKPEIKTRLAQTYQNILVVEERELVASRGLLEEEQAKLELFVAVDDKEMVKEQEDMVKYLEDDIKKKEALAERYGKYLEILR